MSTTFIWIISLLTIALIIIRPFRLSEAIWATAGAALLLITGLLSPAEGWSGIVKGLDVYLFLTGMMLLAETARQAKLFDWLAAHATRLSKGSTIRLFILIYLVGTIVTIFLSNDATAVVLTPAVAYAVRSAKVKNPLPYLLICAFIANAASFVLPISNPANLVIYGEHMPPLFEWLPRYLLPSLVSIVCTGLLLLLTQRKQLNEVIDTEIEIPALGHGGRVALAGIGLTAVVLLTASALDWDLGWPTAITGVLITLIVTVSARLRVSTIVKHVSWAVMPLVGGLFVIVEGLNKTGITQKLTDLLNQASDASAAKTAWASSAVVGVGCNVINNLPAGLIAGNVLQESHVPEIVKSSVLIAVDLGPNLSVTGSLATILWLVALRREGLDVSAWAFLKLGLLIMTVTLAFTIASLFI
ncbi:MAG: arsenic transporter [Citrobacter freundii]|nr:MAG: arsenic transporter [Citrobacter freundii]